MSYINEEKNMLTCPGCFKSNWEYGTAYQKDYHWSVRYCCCGYGFHQKFTIICKTCKMPKDRVVMEVKLPELTYSQILECNCN